MNSNYNTSKKARLKFYQTINISNFSERPYIKARQSNKKLVNYDNVTTFIELTILVIIISSNHIKGNRSHGKI